MTNVVRYFSVFLGVFLSATAFADAMDVTAATTAITDSLASVTSVGMSILGVLAAVVAFAMIRRVMSGR